MIKFKKFQSQKEITTICCNPSFPCHLCLTIRHIETNAGEISMKIKSSAKKERCVMLVSIMRGNSLKELIWWSQEKDISSFLCRVHIHTKLFMLLLLFIWIHPCPERYYHHLHPTITTRHVSPWYYYYTFIQHIRNWVAPWILSLKNGKWSGKFQQRWGWWWKVGINWHE